MTAPRPHLHVFPDGPTVAKAFAEFLRDRMAEKPEGPFFWALSGGSTPKLLFQLLAESYVDLIDWSRIHFFWGDDRMVPYDDPESNYGEVKRLLFDHVPVVPEQIHVVDTSLSPEDAAKAYAETMQNIMPSNADGLPVLDINMLGMGGDGHTASIFPHNIELLEVDNICAVAQHPETGQYRVTMTGPVLRAADQIAFLITGSGKTEKVNQILSAKDGAEALPVAHVTATNGQLHWFLDEAAAADLK
jgi:6-phosphogluconolactonase